MEYYQYLWELGNVNFEYGYYDLAVQYLMECYSISDVYKDEIVESLYSCFITPNIEEFHDTYIKYKSDKNICVFDFIPVTETKYYVYDTTLKTFPFTIETERLKVHGQKNYRGLFITGGYDINQYIDAISISEWNRVYLYDDGTNPYINSLYKIPQWVDYLEESIVVFNDKSEIRDYFISNLGEYLPEIIGDRIEDFTLLFEEIYTERLYGKYEFPEPILSICIPTYNRGITALKNVNKLLKCRLTTELEIMVSDNGSNKGIEQYNIISEIRDNRLSYYRAESNMKYYGNILNCLEKAKGKYVLLISDEDELDIDNLTKYINYIINHEEGAAFNYGGAYVEHEKGFDAIKWAGENNYMSGITFNKRIISENDGIKLLREKQENFYCTLYTHAALMAILGERNNLYETNIPIIIKGEEDAYNSEMSENSRILEYTKLASRIKQLDFYVEFVSFLEEDLRVQVILECYQHTLGMLLLASREYKDNMDYFNICCSIYTHVMKKINNNEGGYGILKFPEAIKAICNLTIQYCAAEFDADFVNKMIDSVNNRVSEKDEISGYKYKEYLLENI